MIAVLEFDSRRGLGIFLFTPPPERLWDPLSLLSNGYQGLFPWGREDNHSPPSSAEVKNAWSYTSTPQYAMMWCSVKAQGQLYLNIHDTVSYLRY